MKTGDVLPEFAVEMNDGNIISTEDVKGKVSVITFFHTLCPDCQTELPVLQKVYEEYSGDDRVMIFAVSREESYDDVSEYWDENGFKIHILLRKIGMYMKCSPHLEFRKFIYQTGKWR